MHNLEQGLSGGGLAVSSLGVTAVVLVCWYYWTHRRVLGVAWQLPTILPLLPAVGHGTGLLGMMNRVLIKGKCAMARGIRSMTLWIGPYPIIVIMDSEDVQTVLNSSRALDRGPELKFVEYVMRRGLLTAPAPIWKATRRHITPMFHPRNLELLMPVLNECGRDLVLDFSSLVDQGQVDIEDYVYSSIFKATCTLVFGPKLASEKLLKNNVHEFMEALVIIPRLAFNRTIQFWLWPETIFNFFYKKKLNSILFTCRNFFERSKKTVEQKQLSKISQAEHDTGNGSQSMPLEEFNVLDDCGSSDHVTLADVYRDLQQAHPSFTDEDLQAEAITILSAGAETTKVTVSTCLLALAANSSIQERLYREIVSVVGHDSEVTLDAIRDMPYLDQVLKETLRKFPIVPLTLRSIQNDIKLSQLTLPAGATVGVIFNAVHSDPRHYPDPERFDPERFTPENVAKRAPHTFVAFGGGPRNCIGRTYAMMSTKTVLVHVVRRFEVTTSLDIDNLTYSIGLVASSVNGYPIKLKARS